jgi:GT2 family glycosyltransferase
VTGVRISLVVPAHRSGPELEASLRSMAALQPPPGEKILACDGPVEAAAAAGFEIVAAGAAGGAAATRNAGARRATGDVVLFLDSDVIVPPDLVGRIGNAFAADPRLTAVFGSYDDAPADASLVSRYRNLLHHFVHQESPGEASTFWAGCGAVSRRALMEVGGFDETYADSSIEDIELGRRLGAAGAVIRLDAGLQVKHLKKWTVGGFLWTDLFRRALPWTRLMLAEGGLHRGLNLGLRHRLGFAATAFLLLSLAAGALSPRALLALPVFGAAFLLSNLRLFAFLWRRGGPTLASAAVPLHLLHSLAACAGFALGAAAHALGSVAGWPGGMTARRPPHRP